MTRGAFILAGCVAIASASPTLAQTGASTRTTSSAKADAITGTWTGELAPQNVQQPAKVTLELKFDGKSSVSGTMTGLPNPGDVKTGTFDPKTGVLKLQLGKQGDSTVLLVLEGKVVKGTVSGQLTGDAGDGPFKLTKKP